MMKRLIAVVMLCAFWTSHLHAATPSTITREDQRDVMVTIYNGNLGLVKDVRRARFDAGAVEVRFMDVAALIDPASVHLKSLTEAGKLKIVEQNYEYDHISLRNHKKEAITVEVIEPVPGDWEVLRSTLPHDKIEAFTMRYRVPVPKEGEAKLNYRVRVRF